MLVYSGIFVFFSFCGGGRGGGVKDEDEQFEIYVINMLSSSFYCVSGFESRRRPSPTEHSHRSIQEPANTKRPLIVNLPPVNVKEKPTMMEVQPDSLVSQQAVTDGKDFGGGTLNIVIPQGKQRVEGYDNEGRRHSFPDCSPKKEEQNEMKRCFSELTMKKKRKINLGKGQFD